MDTSNESYTIEETFSPATPKPKRKKAKKVAKKATGKGPKFGNDRVAQVIRAFKTVAEISKTLKVTKVTAQAYVTRLRKTKKLATKKVRQGERGPLAIAYKVA